jgi:hypothetical protein
MKIVHNALLDVTISWLKHWFSMCATFPRWDFTLDGTPTSFRGLASGPADFLGQNF